MAHGVVISIPRLRFSLDAWGVYVVKGVRVYNDVTCHAILYKKGVFWKLDLFAVCLYGEAVLR